MTKQANAEEQKNHNRIMVKTSRKLPSLNDGKAEKNHTVTTFTDKYNRKILKYSFNYKLPIVGILKDFFTKKIQAPEDVDKFWMYVYCVKGLMDIETVSEEIALLFCPFAATRSVIGNLVNLKIEFAEYLMSIYTKAFV